MPSVPPTSPSYRALDIHRLSSPKPPHIHEHLLTHPLSFLGIQVKIDGSEVSEGAVEGKEDCYKVTLSTKTSTAFSAVVKVVLVGQSCTDEVLQRRIACADLTESLYGLSALLFHQFQVYNIAGHTPA